MDVVVVYESLFGNTRLVAEAIADGYPGFQSSRCVSVTRDRMPRSSARLVMRAPLGGRRPTT